MAPYAARTTFSFDYVFPESATQREVYEHVMPDLIQAILHGYNASVFAYGQTSSGKSYTISGVTGGPVETQEQGAMKNFGRGAETGEAGDSRDSRAGLVYRTIDELFARINELRRRSGGAWEFVVSVSYLQIYNEQIGDLLNDQATNLRIREIVDPSQLSRGGPGGQERPAPTVYVENLREYTVTTAEEVRRVLAYGSRARATAVTQMNADSSRSHSVFTVTVRQRLPSDPALCEGGTPGATLVSKLNVIDLAGSERLTLSKVSNERLEETKKINTSLTVLGNVIAALVEQAKGKKVHIAYRDSKLTRLLQNSLGGNSITVFIATVSPSSECYSESLNTLKFATRVKKVKNKVFQNEVLDKREMVRRYEQEIADLKTQLAALEEADMAASGVKHAAGVETPKSDENVSEIAKHLFVEQKTKSRLEQRLKELQAVLASQGVEEPASPETKGSLLPDIQEILRSPENERLNADAYRRLLLKQKDVIISLMSRLTERDRELYDVRSQLDIEANYQEELESEVGDKFDYLRDLILRVLGPQEASGELKGLRTLLAGLKPEEAFDKDGDLSEALLLRLGINRADYCIDNLLGDETDVGGIGGVSQMLGNLPAQLNTPNQPQPLPEGFGNDIPGAPQETLAPSASQGSPSPEPPDTPKMSPSEKVAELRRLLAEKEEEARDVSKRLASAESSCSVAMEALRHTVSDLSSSIIQQDPRVSALGRKQREAKSASGSRPKSVRFSDGPASSGAPPAPPPAPSTPPGTSGPAVNFSELYGSMRQERGFLIKIFKNKLVPMGERLRRLLAEGRNAEAETQLRQLRGLVEATSDALRSSDVCSQVCAALGG